MKLPVLAMLSPVLLFATTFVPPKDLPPQNGLPDPLVWLNGTRVTNVAEWKSRKLELRAPP